MDEDDIIEEESKVIEEDSGGGDDAGWLTSYADLMTLVACFFILMMAFANYDLNLSRKADLLAKYFKGEDESSDDPSRRLLMKIQSVSNLEEITEIRTSEDGIELILNVKTLFRLGSASLLKMLKKY